MKCTLTPLSALLLAVLAANAQAAAATLPPLDPYGGATTGRNTGS